MRDAAPEILQTLDACVRIVTRDDAGVDRADRCADHPVGLDVSLVKRLIDACLIGAERAAALEHQHDLVLPVVQIGRGGVPKAADMMIVAHGYLP